jgi:hypothetical protein
MSSSEKYFVEIISLWEEFDEQKISVIIKKLKALGDIE